MDKQTLEYIKIPPNSSIVIGSSLLNPAVPYPVLMSKEDKQRGDVSIASIKAGLLEALSHKGGNDKLANDNFEYYKNIILGEKDALNNMLLAAKVRLSKNDYDNAETLLKAFLNIESNEEAFILLASLYASKAKEAKTDELYEQYDSLLLETLKRALSVFPDSVSLLYELGSFHFREGNRESAVSYFERFLSKVDEKDPRYKNALKLKNAADESIKEEDEASTVYDDIMMDRKEEAQSKALSLLNSHPNEWQYHLLYGWALRVNEKYKEAHDELMKALKMGGDDSTLFNELSLSEWEVGSKSLAKEYMKMASDIDSDNAMFLSNLAIMCINTDDIEEAERAIYSLIEKDEKDPLIDELIRAYNKKAPLPFVKPQKKQNCECEEHHHDHNHKE